MRTRLGTQGRLKAVARASASGLLTLLLLTAVIGCGTQQAKQAPTGSQSQGETQSEETAVATAQDPATEEATALKPATHLPARGPAGPIHRISLSDKRCIQFEPQWTSVRMGQSVTWHSELKSPVTIYVSPGVFSKLSFVVRPGATVSTGPARAVGRFSFWTEPSACRDAPRGVLLSGPGVTVDETFYASTGIR